MAFPIVLARNSEFANERKRCMEIFNMRREDIFVLKTNIFELLLHDDFNSYSFIHKFAFKHNFDPVEYKKKEIEFHATEFQQQIEAKKLLPLTGSTDENIIATLKYVVRKIKDLGILICDVKYNLANYHNRHVSALCGNNDVFTFMCKKNNYSFEAVFYDDCDCYPGMLIVSSIINNKSGQKTVLHCDLLCGNTGKKTLKNFMKMITYDNYEEYKININNKIKKGLEDGGFVVNKFVMNDRDLDANSVFYIATELCEYQIKCCYTDDVLDFQIGPCGKRYIVEYYDVFNTNKFCCKVGMDEFAKLHKCINANIRYMKNEYGYCDENKEWKNEYDIIRYLNECDRKIMSNSVKIKMPYHTREEYDEFRIDIDYKFSIIVGVCEIGNDFINSDLKWPVEFYNIHFTYDRNKSDKCHMLIEGKYHNLDFLKEYVCNTKKFIENYENKKLHIGTEIYEGTFEYVFGILKDFVNILVKAKLYLTYDQCEETEAECYVDELNL